MASQSCSLRKRKGPTEQVVPGVDCAGSSSPLLGSRHSYERNTNAPSTDLGPDYPIPNFDEVYSRMRHPETGFKVADRRWRLLQYPKCFIGSEAVQWMVENMELDQVAAIQTGQHLMDAGIMHHVTHSEPFSDNYHFFRFQEDDESSVLNMKRIWDPARPPRNPVEVSQDLLTRLACLCEEHRLRIITAPATPQVSSNPPTDHVPELSQLCHTVEALNSAQSASVLSRPPEPSTPVARDPYSSRAIATQSLPSVSHGSDIYPMSTKLICGASDDVDYALVAKSEDFRLYTLATAELQRVQLLGLEQDERIAFFGNIYNTLCLHCYIVQGPPTNVYRRWLFFRTLSYRIAGLDMTLDDIEHGILRGNKRAPMIKILQQLRPFDPKCQHVLTKRDGRIHFVISAGTRSDPPIRILDGECVQEQLHDATVDFLCHSMKINESTRTITLPRIFMWYADDFPAPERELLRWVGQYLLAEPARALSRLLSSEDVSITIQYENFDWCASDTRFNAAVVRRKRRRLERELAAAANGLGGLASSPNLHGRGSVSLEGFDIVSPRLPFSTGEQISPDLSSFMTRSELQMSSNVASPVLGFPSLPGTGPIFHGEVFDRSTNRRTNDTTETSQKHSGSVELLIGQDAVSPALQSSHPGRKQVQDEKFLSHLSERQ